jgi:hypothetical protein
MRSSLASRALAVATVAPILAVLSLAGCGDDGGEGAEVSTGPPATAGGTAPPASPPTTAVAAGIQHPLGADDVVLSVGYEGGFVPVGVAFANLPTLLVTGDGTAVVTGPQIAIHPGPLLPNLQQGRLDEAALQELLRSARQHGLLAAVEYPRNDMIADASDVVVRIAADGGSFEHRAYALGLEDETDPARAALAAFVADATAVTDDVMATATPFASDAFLIQARPVAPEDLGDDVPPSVVPWPTDHAVRLAGASFCATVPWADGEALFADATQATLFDDAGTTYQITAVPRLPGRSC